jgi:hypothetical protein
VSGGGTVDATGAFTAGMVEGGPFLVTAVAGAASSSAQVTIVATPDTEAPTVSVTAPVPNAQVMGMQSVTATASDNVGVVNVDFFVDGTTSIGSVAMAPYGVVLDVAALSDGMHSLTARARDAAGNTTTSAPVPVFVGMSGPVDVTPPVVSLDTPTVGAMTGLQVSVSATASDDLGVTGVDFELDGVVVQTFTTGPFTSVVPVSVGAHTLVAIARAIVTEPAVVLADEPTGNLDTQRSHEIMSLLVGLNRDHGITVLMVTHEPDMAAYAHRMVHFKDGKVAKDAANPNPTSSPPTLTDLTQETV